MEILEEIRKKVESEYQARQAILETAKLQIEEKIKALTQDAENLAAKMAELLQKESAIDDPNEALEVRKQYKELRDLLDITNERLESAKEKRSEILRGIAQLEREKNEQIKENLRQEFPRICENLLDGLSMRIIATAEALRPYVKAFATPATDERVLARFLRLRLSRQVRQISDLAFDILGRPDAFNEDNFRSWPSFWKFWSWQTHFPVSVKAEDSTVTEKKAEDQAETKRIEIEL
jgi:hypothetical protein